MAIVLKKITGSIARVGPRYCIRKFSEQSFDQTGSRILGSEVQSEFRKWGNGGGFIHVSAQIDPTVVVEIGAVVYPKSVLEANVHIQSGAVVGPAVTIGHSTKVGYNTALTNCSIGDSCIIHNGACIGQDGFGFYVDEQGNMLKKPQ
ncbi:hypothetical protein MKW94_006981, partial [Papaver nudicaule]|nr:hypothetical protein [Papaver nudicaule]